MSTAVGEAGRQSTGTAAGSGLHRDFGRIALLFTSVGSVIGSGWLLGALNATTAAGPAAIISWVAGAIAVMLLALVCAELGGMHPVNGGIARFPHYAFGSLVGFGMGWIYWLGSVTLAPVETEAALQYGDHWTNKWFGFHVVHMSGGQTVLTGAGYIVGAALMAVFVLINLWGAKRLSESNTAVVWWKIA
ncbi:MAG: APC family permease, partial [Solirubrobacteraceae bacterium]